MRIENQTAYLRTTELRSRIATALAVARRRLTAAEFSSFAPQLQEKIEDIDRAIADYQSVCLNAAIVGLFVTYSCVATRLPSRQPTVFLDSIDWAGTATGPPDPIHPPQLSLPLGAASCA